LGSARVSRWISDILKENGGMRKIETDRKTKTIKQQRCSSRSTVRKESKF